MRRHARVLHAALWVLCATHASLAAEKSGTPAAQFVLAALDAERQGDDELRGQLLAEALRVDPEYAPAHWHVGQVRQRGGWRPVSEIARESGRDPVLDRYQEARRQWGKSPAGQLMLARWCRRQGLSAEARVHWLQVLSAWPRHSEALRSLDARWDHGELVSRETAQLRQQREQTARRSVAEWNSRLDAWRRAIEHGTPLERRQAVQELEGVRDPGAAPALLASLRQGNLDVAFAKIEALGQLEGPVATDALLSIVVDPRSPGLQAAAARKLDDRPKDYVVGRLLEALAFPLESTGGISFTPSGGFHLWQTVSQDGAGGEREVTFHTNFEQIFRRVAPTAQIRTTANSGQVLAFAAQAAEQTALRAEDQVRNWNTRARQRNVALTDALERVTGESFGPDPRSWWNWWYGQSPEYRPERVLRHDDVYSYWQYTHLVPAASSGSCFAAGTRVQTQRGPKAIETIEPGDQVLSQDAVTGELRFAAVLMTTLRPKGAMVRVRVGEEEILATEVHPFWVTGQAWKIARSLEPGDRLHTLSGTARVDGVEEAGEHDAYNLVVDGFHSYFVGQAQSLVHDVTLQAPIEAALPGLAANDSTAP